MRALATLLILTTAFGCGPAVNNSPTEEDWMLGTFSYTSMLCGDTCRGGAQRFDLSEDGHGQVTAVGCEESSEPLSWSLLDDGSVRIEWDASGTPESITFSPPVCDDDGLLIYEGTRTFQVTPTSNESTSPTILYRSTPCPGQYIPGDDCMDDGNECDPRGFCEVVWCEGGEPERCE